MIEIMSTPWMIESFVFVPELISIGAMVVLFLTGIKEFRQGHIGRVGIVTNVFLMWQVLLPHWSNISVAFQWYGNIGTIFAAVAAPSYLVKKSLPTAFYNIAFLFYGSISLVIAALVIL